MYPPLSFYCPWTKSNKSFSIGTYFCNQVYYVQNYSQVVSCVYNVQFSLHSASGRHRQWTCSATRTNGHLFTVYVYTVRQSSILHCWLTSLSKRHRYLLAYLAVKFIVISNYLPYRTTELFLILLQSS